MRKLEAPERTLEVALSCNSKRHFYILVENNIAKICDENGVHLPYEKNIDLVLGILASLNFRVDSIKDWLGRIEVNYNQLKKEKP